MTCSYSFSLCVFYENNKQYCLLTKYLTHSTRIDGRLMPSKLKHPHTLLYELLTLRPRERKQSTLVCRLPTAFRPRQVVRIVSHASYYEKR